MKLKSHSIVASLAAGLALLAQTGPAQTTGGTLVDIAPCLDVRVDAERLACYDGLGATPAAPQTQKTAVPEPPAVADFGRSAPAAEAQVLVGAEGEAELVDVIAGLKERVPGRYLITLASGQVWYQANSQRMRLRVGNEVRIYPSPLGGSWRMARADGEQSGFIQVTRVE